MKVKGLTKQKLIWLIIASVLLTAFFVIHGISLSIASSLSDQKEASRWSEDGGYAQISAFFSQNAGVSEDTLKSFEYNLTEKLAEESITVSEDDNDARLFASCYASKGIIAVTSEQGTEDLTAIGVGGDFFMFHELELLGGGYFSSSEDMDDYALLDETAAWKLFGSNDVEGLTVFVGNTPLIIRGVVSLPSGSLAEQAGVPEGTVFLSYSYLLEHGTVGAISSYEIVMPNPVKGYALGKVTDCIGIAAEDVELVDNTDRFSLSNRIALIGSYNTRAMNAKEIAYPWWENIVRAKENTVGLLTFLWLFCAGAAAVIFIIVLVVFIVQNDELRLYTKLLIRYFFRHLIEGINEKLYRRKNG